MELRQLEYFQMVSRLNSITKAANSLHVSQPSVTVSIRKLEEELGVTLFDRSQRQLPPGHPLGNLSSMEQIAASSQALARLAMDLREAVSKFQV